jgi:tetratricopeptide (TPR) repeat protein
VIRCAVPDDPRSALERAEREPLLGHRAAAVRAAIDAAAPLLEAAEPELRARLLLRLASVKIAEGDYEGADQALEAAGRHAPDDTLLRFLAGVRACRVAIRRGPSARELAHATLLQAAAHLPEVSAGAPGWDVVTCEVALAIAELALHDDPPAASAFEPLRELVTGIADADIAFATHELLAAYALSIGEPQRAAHALRAAVAIAHEAASPADEVEARLALAGALVATGEPIAREEAASTVRHALELTDRHALVELRHAALIAEAGVLASAGKTAGAIDRVLELARASVARGDIAQYVAAVGIMAELYARSGDHVSAFRTIVEAHRALANATGSDVTERFRPLLARLRDRIGAERLSTIAADVEQANRIADQIAPQKRNDPS